jgi:hypothetical protein
MNDIEKLSQQIITNLRNNGLPHKKVSLPLEKMYEISDKKGISFNKVLEHLKTKNIFSKSDTDRIIFEERNTHQQNDTLSQAMDMLKKMGPEQLKEMKDKIANLSDPEKKELLEKGKEFGLS